MRLRMDGDPGTRFQAPKRVGPPLISQGTSPKLDRLQAVGYYKIMKKLNTDQVMKRIVTAVNIATGDDGDRAKEVLENFVSLCKMDEKKYAQQVKYYG